MFSSQFKMAALKIAVALSASCFVLPSAAFACGGIFDAACNLQHGGLSPNNIAKQVGKAGQDTANTVAKAGQDVANALNELQASVLSGPALEQAIVSSHNTAVNGSMPIPPQIRQLLTGYASEDSMNRVRYKIGDSGFVNVAHLLEQGGVASAVTLIDVVVFRGPSEAADPSVWAHELTHVDQYAAWGVHSFAVQYTRNFRSVEDAAYAKGDGYQAWVLSNSNPVLVNQVPAQSQPMPYCATPAGSFGPDPALNAPQGAPCSHTFPNGLVIDGQVVWG